MGATKRHGIRIAIDVRHGHESAVLLFALLTARSEGEPSQTALVIQGVEIWKMM